MNVQTLLSDKSKRFTGKQAIIFKDKSLSFLELHKETLRVCNLLLGLGIKKQDRLAICLPNSLECVLFYLAGFSLGCVVIPLDSRLGPQELIYTLKHAEPRFLVSGFLRNISLDEIEKEVSSIEKIIDCFSPVENKGDHIYYLNDILDKIEAKEFSSQIEDKDYSAIFYTSGTTSEPKGVLWNYRHLDAAPKAMEHFVDLSERDIKLCCLPLSHIGGLVYLQNCIVYGITLVLMEQFIPQLFLSNIQRYKVTCMHLVPTIFAAILNTKEFENTDLSSLRWVVVFGAPNNPAVLERFNKYCPRASLINGYGLTETAAPNTVSPLGRIDTVGRPAPWIDVAIFNEEDKPQGINEIGEIVMKGWPIMEGYFKQPELTKEVIKDGWFHTGDLGRIDEQGFLYIVGRKKDMIKVGGLVVYPVEIENIISKYPGVVEVAVVGISDVLRGEKVKAYVVTDGREEISADDIKSFCRKHLASFKVPDVIEFRDSLPKTPSGKIKKTELGS